MKLHLGFSPCPNDTFIFDALVNGIIDTSGLEFETHLEDVQTLNQWALEGKLDLTKISYGVWPLVKDNYHLLDAGGALGKGVGPLLISKKSMSHTEINQSLVAIPGKNTTANVLFSLAFPEAKNKTFMLFYEIENAVLSGRVDCGVIIHENRFTYHEKGLTKLVDLGNFWEEKTGCPIPLGGIILRRDFPEELQEKINSLIKKSVEYAFQNYPALPDYVKIHSQEMEEQVMRQHIDLYVNHFSITLGNAGRQAVKTFLDIYNNMNEKEFQCLMQHRSLGF